MERFKKAQKLPLSNMDQIRPFDRKVDELTDYARSLAYLLFEGVPRDSGRPYTSEHLAKVALLIREVTVPSLYKNSAEAAGWLHDVVEDIKGIDVVNPFKEAEREKGIIYLNDLLKEAREKGKNVCYIDNLLTHREGVDYEDYFKEIFSFPEKPGRERNLHILAAVAKVCDIWSNTNPDEKIDLERLLKQNPDADPKKLEKGYVTKQQTGATNNLGLYLPLAEVELLARIGKDNKLFNWRKVSRIVEETYINSLRMYTGELQGVTNLGLNRNRQPIEGYERILDKILEKLAKGELVIEKIV